MKAWAVSEPGATNPLLVIRAHSRVEAIALASDCTVGEVGSALWVNNGVECYRPADGTNRLWVIDGPVSA